MSRLIKEIHSYKLGKFIHSYEKTLISQSVNFKYRNDALAIYSIYKLNLPTDLIVRIIEYLGAYKHSDLQKKLMEKILIYPSPDNKINSRFIYLLAKNQTNSAEKKVSRITTCIMRNHLKKKSVIQCVKNYFVGKKVLAYCNENGIKAELFENPKVLVKRIDRIYTGYWGWDIKSGKMEIVNAKVPAVFIKTLV